MKTIIFFLIFIISLSVAQENTGRLMNEAELQVAYEKAITNTDVIAYKRLLESQGYVHERENSIGVLRNSDGSFFINLAFNKGDNQLTTHIIYREWANGNRKVSFWEGKINDDGSVTTLSEYLIENGTRGTDIEVMSKITAGHCILAGCGGGLAACLFANCAYLKCLAGWCVGSLVSCLLLWVFGGF